MPEGIIEHMQFSLITNPADWQNLEVEWKALEARTHRRLPFLEFWYQQTWWRTLGGGEWSRESSRLQLIIARQDGTPTYNFCVVVDDWDMKITHVIRITGLQPFTRYWYRVRFADFAMAHPLWFLKGTHVTAPLVDDYPEVAAWLGRVLGFGHGAHSPLSSEEAIAIAREAQPAPLPDEDFSQALGFQVGQQVSVAATDYGVDPVQGELLCVSAEAIILRRQDERAGTLHVHFPRLGFALSAV